MAEVPKSIKASLYIDGKPAESSLKNIKTVTQTLRRELDLITVGTEEWNRAMLKLRAHEATLRNIQNEVRGVGGAFGWLKTEIGKLGALAVGYLGFQFITSQFQNIIMANAKLSDSLADIRRVAGLTEREVLNLNKSFKDLDTRTSSADLRGIAIIGGKLGVAKGQLLEFTAAVDKLVVTLGDELGNADQITTNLGKILNVFQGEVTGENITHLGNAMVVLANAGVASGGFIAEFAQRVSGIAVSAHLSLGATVGLAAGLEELGGKVESSSTAITRLLSDIGTDLPKAARIAKIPLADFQKLFDTTPEKALLAYASGLVKNKTAFSEITASFKDAGEEGQRVVSTLAALGNKAEFMQQKIDLGNKSLLETSAINEGFALKNETFGASVDKLSKKFSQLTASNGVSGFFQNIILLTTKVVDGLIRLSGAIGTLLRFLTIGGVAWLTYGAYVAAANSTWLAFVANLVTGEKVMALSRTATIALAGAKALLAGNFAKAAQAARLLNLTLLSNPIAIVAAAVLAGVTAFVLFKETAEDATKKMVDHAAQLTKTALAQKESVAMMDNNLIPLLNRYDQLKAKAKLNSDEQAELHNVIGQVAKIIPSAITGFDQYGNALDINADKARKFIEEQRAMLKFQNKDAIRENAQARNALVDEQNMLLRQLRKGTKESMIGAGTAGVGTNIIEQLSDQDIASIRARIKEIVMMKKEIDDAIHGLQGGSQPVTPPKPPTDEKKGPIILTVGARRKQLQDLIKKLDEDYDKLANADKAGQVKIRAAQKSYQKELDDLDGKNEKAELKKIETVQSSSQKISDIIAKFNKDQLAAQMDKNHKEIQEAENKYDELIKLANDWINNNKTATPAQKEAHKAEIVQLDADKQKTVNNIILRQEQELNDRIKELRISLGDAYETERQKEIDRINHFYDERLRLGDDAAVVEAARATDLSNAKIREEQRFQDAVDEINAEGVVTEAQREELRKARINKKYDDKIVNLKKQFSKELQLTKAFQAEIDKINGIRAAEIEQKTGVSEKEKWDKIRDVAIDSAQNLANGVFEIGRANRQAETDAEIDKLEKQKDRELNNKNLTEEQRTAIQERFAKKEAEIKLKAWKADRDAALAQAIINGALAITKALTSAPWPLNLISAAGSAIATGIEIAKISSTKPPQYADGGFSDEDPAGYVGQPTIFKQSASGRPFVAGEAGREWIAPNWMLQNPRTANIIGMLESARRDRRAFAGGGYNGSGAAAAPVIQNNFDVAILIDKLDQVQQSIKDQKVLFDMRAFDVANGKRTDIRNSAKA